MPPHPSLPLRDGRLGSSSLLHNSSQQHIEPYYSNEDIKLLHEIVTSAEDIYPVLPERDRLPTNALFQAAEQVLPAHGYDPDHAPSNISRLIFKIGGLRSDGSLMDKFRSVLESMGIEIEFVQSPVQQEQPQPGYRDRSSSVRSAGSFRSSVAGNPADQTGTFPIAPHYGGRRRRNSESAAPTAPLDHVRGVPTIFNRARSISVGSRRSEGLEQVRGAQDARRPLAQGHWAEEAEAIQAEDEVEEWRPTVLPIRSRHFLVHEAEEDNDIPYGRNDMENYPASYIEEVEEYGDGGVQHSSAPYSYDLPRAGDVSDVDAGTDEATAETSHDLRSDPILVEDIHAVLEKKVRAFQNRHTKSTITQAFVDWEKVAEEAGEMRSEQEARAVSAATHGALSHSVEQWEQIVWERKKLRRAAKAYDLYLVHKSFSHWETCALAEHERTAIARRHMLRIRYFTLWRSHQAETKKKLHQFILGACVRTWTRAYLHREVQQNVSLDREHDNLVKQVCNTWLDGYRSRFADRVRTLRLKENCIRVWHAKTRQAVDIHEGILIHEREQLLDDAFSTWHALGEDMHATAYERFNQKVTHDLQSMLDVWRIKAHMSRNLRETMERREQQLESRVIDCWLSKTADATGKAQVATRLVSQKVIFHWQNEAKLKQFQSRSLAQGKLHAFSHWRLQQQLASFDRHSEMQTKERVLVRLRTAAVQAHTRAVRGRRLADSYADRSLKASILSSWEVKASAALEDRDTAITMHFHNTVNSCLGLWCARTDEVAAARVEYEKFADRGAYYCLASNTLTQWAAVADRTRRARLTKTYHAFRRKHKSDLAAKCLSRWQAMARNALALGSEADMVRETRIDDTLIECVRHWEEQARTMQTINQVAKEAELEVWLGKWTTRVTELRETEMDAADYCKEQVMSRCWKNWEFAALQNRGRQNTVTAFKEKNDKRLCRHVLDIWLQKGAPTSDGLLLDPRSSVASRRSVRYSNVRPSSVRPASTPQPFQATITEDSVTEQLLLPRLPLGGESRHAASLQGQSGRQPEPPRRQFGDNIKGLSYSVPPRPRGSIRQEPTSIVATPLPRHLDQQRSHTTPRPRDDPPFPDFDEDDTSFTPSEAGDPDHPATFMSTPTRWTGTAKSVASSRQQQQQQQQNPGRVFRPSLLANTTTPSALLDTPHERALRREYTAPGGGGSRSVGPGVGAGVRFTPRVTFADIREESGEDSRIFDTRR